MEYRVKIVKKAQKDIHIYKVLKKSNGNINILTKLFIRVFSGIGQKKEKEDF
jgi:hypothetical protein